MADKMLLTITLRKEVPNEQTGRTLYEAVKTKMQDNPEVKINGHVAQYFEMEGG